MTEDTSPTGDDLIVTVNDPAGTPANRRVTITNLNTFINSNTSHASRHNPGGADALALGTPSGLANANAAGTATSLVRADHGHKRDVRVSVAGTDVGTRNRLNFLAHRIADDVANDELDIEPGWNPRQGFFAHTDCDPLSQASQITTANIAGGITLSTQAVDDELGVDRITSGAVSGDGGIMSPPSYTVDFHQNAIVIVRFRIQVATSIECFAGISSNSTAGIPAATEQSAGFLIDIASSANYRVLTSDGTTRNIVDYVPATAVNTAWRTIRIVRNATSIDFYLDDSAAQNITANLPNQTSATLFLQLTVVTRTAASRWVERSYWSHIRTAMSR